MAKRYGGGRGHDAVSFPGRLTARRQERYHGAALRTLDLLTLPAAGKARHEGRAGAGSAP